MAYLRKRGQTWSYVISGPKDPVTNKHKQITKGGFRTETEARKAATKIENEINENRYVQPSKEKFSTFVEHWFNTHYSKRIKVTTSSNRKNIMDKHLLKENPFAHKELGKVTKEDIDGLYSLKIDEGYSSSYIRKIHTMLKQAFREAVGWKRIQSSPMDNVIPPVIKTEKPTIWNFDQIHTFLEKCSGERHHLTFLLAIFTGMRRGEILGLKWADIDFKNNFIDVKRSLAYIPEEGYILTTLKTENAYRQIPITDDLIQELQNHRELQKLEKQTFGNAYSDNDLVICTETGTMQDPRNVLRTLKRIIDSAKVPEIRFHDFRHTHASILISKGVDYMKLSKRLGHSNPRITLEFYAHSLNDGDKDVADIFHSAFINSKRTDVNKM